MKIDHEQHERIINRRGIIMLGGSVIGLGILGSRLYHLQIKQGEYFQDEAGRNRTDIEVILPERGAILDDQGRIIADNIVEYDLIIQEDLQNISAQKIKDFMKLLQLDAATQSHLVDRILLEHKRPLHLLRNLSEDQLMRLEFHRPQLMQFAINKNIRRHYFYGPSLSPISGYIGRPSEKDRQDHPNALMAEFRIGKAGLEQKYEDMLQGENGTKSVKVDVYGKRLEEISREQSLSGHDLQLHLNAELQQFAMQRLSTHRSGAVVVLDAFTGGVKALASHPFYDANDFKEALSKKKWDALIKDPLKPMIHKAISGLYAPGSTFKPIVALAALKAGISPDSTHFCGGHVQLGKTRFHCWKKHGHGNMNMHQAIQQSCDVWFYKTAQTLGIEAIAAAARQVGFGSVTGLDIAGEKSGLVPDKAWKKDTLNQPFYKGELLIHGIGQGFLLTTPLQIARTYGCFINGGRLFQSAIAKKFQKNNTTSAEVIPSVSEQLDIPQQHLDLIKQALIDAVNTPRGTAWRSRLESTANFDMAGKTGTTQVRRISQAERASGIRKENIDWHLRDHALFAGFAPVDNPRFVVCILVEHGISGARSAAPIARDIFLKMANLGMIKPSKNDTALKNTPTAS